jgi:hypothetical protein
LVSVTPLILRFVNVQNKFLQTKKTKINHINDNHIKFKVSLHFGGIWPTVRHTMGQDCPKCKETPSHSECYWFYLFFVLMYPYGSLGVHLVPKRNYSDSQDMFFLHVHPLFVIVYPLEGLRFLYIFDDPGLLCAMPMQVCISFNKKSFFLLAILDRKNWLFGVAFRPQNPLKSSPEHFFFKTKCTLSHFTK